MRMPLLLLLLTGVARLASAQSPPIVFVHGNGDDAAKWIPIIWLFESNGYPADRLFAVRFTNPNARNDDSRPEPFRSSTVDQAAELSAAVTRALLETRAPKVVLIGSSRGGLTIRNYLRFGGGAAVVSQAILAGTPNHGVAAVGPATGSEFSAHGPFLTRLNAGTEVVPGVRFLTLRSDKQDKYAQPAGGIGYEGPELAGAENVVLPGLDHRELAFDARAFAEMYRFVTGHAPERLTPAPEAAPVISGLVTGYGGGAATNRPLSGVRLRVFALRPGSAEREAQPALEAVTDDTGSWGPLRALPGVEYEFLLERDGHAVSYFKAPLPRSTALLNLRFPPLRPSGDDGLQLLLSRPQGYFSKGRDPVRIDGVEAPEIPAGIPTRDAITVTLDPAKAKGVLVELRDEKIWARPAKAGGTELSVVDFLHE